MTDALPEAARKAGLFAWRWIIPIVMFALVTVIVAYHSRDELRPGVAWLQRVAGEIQDQSMFSVAEEVQAQVHVVGPRRCRFRSTSSRPASRPRRSSRARCSQRSGRALGPWAGSNS